MPCSSSLTDAEWAILEPLLHQILPQKKRTRPSNWTKRQILDGILYQLKNGHHWEDLPPYSTVHWVYGNDSDEKGANLSKLPSRNGSIFEVSYPTFLA